MRIATSILLTLILLAMGQAAFAQAPKDVNVVNNPTVTVNNLPAVQSIDGAVEITNGPSNPASVLIEGAVNPLQIIDVTAPSESFSQVLIMTQNGPVVSQGLITMPTGKALILQGISARQWGEVGADFRFSLYTQFDPSLVGPMLYLEPDGVLHRTGQAVFGFPEFDEGSVLREFDYLPPITTLSVSCERFHTPSISSALAQSCFVQVWGVEIDTP